MIITIGGLAGTGTTTTAELLSEKLDIPYISAGFIFREMAAEHGMSVLEFSEFAEGNDDIDKEIEQKDECATICNLPRWQSRGNGHHLSYYI